MVGVFFGSFLPSFCAFAPAFAPTDLARGRLPAGALVVVMLGLGCDFALADTF